MDAILEKFSSKRAGLGLFFLWQLAKMAEAQPDNAFKFAVLMAVVVAGFMVSEYLEKNRGNGKDAG